MTPGEPVRSVGRRPTGRWPGPPVPEGPGVGRVALRDLGRFGSRNPIRVLPPEQWVRPPVVNPGALRPVLFTLLGVPVSAGTVLVVGAVVLIAVAAYGGYLYYRDPAPESTPLSEPRPEPLPEGGQPGVGSPPSIEPGLWAPGGRGAGRVEPERPLPIAVAGGEVDSASGGFDAVRRDLERIERLRKWVRDVLDESAESRLEPLDERLSVIWSWIQDQSSYAPDPAEFLRDPAAVAGAVRSQRRFLEEFVSYDFWDEATLPELHRAAVAQDPARSVLDRLRAGAEQRPARGRPPGSDTVPEPAAAEAEATLGVDGTASVTEIERAANELLRRRGYPPGRTIHSGEPAEVVRIRVALATLVRQRLNRLPDPDVDMARRLFGYRRVVEVTPATLRSWLREQAATIPRGDPVSNDIRRHEIWSIYRVLRRSLNR